MDKDSQRPPDSNHSRKQNSIDTIMEKKSNEPLTPAPLFRESKITIAVDVSGSTYSGALAAETKAIRGVCSLFPPTLRKSIKVLPWCDFAQHPINLSDLSDLESNGGTDPNVILDDAECRYELQSSSFWFLMTDGEIEEIAARHFAEGLVEYGLHGIASVVSVFGNKITPPAQCNISVGLSVFAVSPHCAFLFTDVDTGHTYIMQTKGCFSAILPKGASNPLLRNNTTWDDLPRVSYENLSRVSIPPPQAVSKDEVILSDNSRVNLETLFSSPKVDKELAGRILDHEDNMKTVALSAKLRGQTSQLREWLDSVEKSIGQDLNPDEVERPEDDSQSNLLSDAISRLMTPEDPFETEDVEDEQALLENQRVLREANARDLETFHVMVESADHQSRRRQSSTSQARQISYNSIELAVDNISGFDYDDEDDFMHPSSRLYPFTPDTTPTINNHQRRGSLMNPGFYKPDVSKDYYAGQCMLCASTGSVMALLLDTPIPELETPNFPKPGSCSQLKFPLAMGNYPETDIISSIVACDPCAFKLAKRQATSSGTKQTVLPLVSFQKNRIAWLHTLQKATQKRFDMENLPLIFLSIVYAKLERLLDEGGTMKAQSLRSALRWQCNTLIAEVKNVVIAEVIEENITMSDFQLDLAKLFQGTIDNVSST